jgi:hypothetical protein
LYEWYNVLLKNTDLTKDDVVKKITDSITLPCKNDKEKVKNIFNYVKNNIAYLAYEDGLGGYVPREASLVCKRKFGDCKDMANLIFSMAQSINLPVYRTWIGTRDIPYQFSDFAAPFCANHMIATYINKTDTVFLDATGKFHPFGLPTAMIQGKEAFIGLDKQNYLLTKVPYIISANNTTLDSVTLTLTNTKNIIGSGKYKINGYGKIDLLTLFSNNSVKWQKNYLQGVLEKGNNKFSLDSFNIVPAENEYLPLVLNYTFTIKDYVIENNKTKYINLNFAKEYFDNFNINSRIYPYHFSYATVDRLFVELKTSGYNIDFVPENTSQKNRNLDYDLRYFKNTTSIVFDNTINLKTSSIEKQDFTAFNETVSNYKKSKSSLVSISLK